MADSLAAGFTEVPKVQKELKLLIIKMRDTFKVLYLGSKGDCINKLHNCKSVLKEFRVFRSLLKR